MNENYLTEAFKSLSLLNEDTFNVNKEGIKELSDFEEKDKNDTEEVEVIDTEAETVDDLKDSYIGKIILDCNVCHSKIYKDRDALVIDDDDNVNIDEECPWCYSKLGYKIIGKIVDYDDKDIEDTDETEEETEIDIDELEECINRLTEDEMSDEDKHDTEVLKNIYRKTQSRINAKLTDDEKAVLNKYNLVRNYGDINVKHDYIDGKLYKRDDSVVSKADLENDQINLADRARKLPDRLKRDYTYDDMQRDRVKSMKQALSSRDAFNQRLIYNDKRYDDTVKKAKIDHDRDEKIYKSIIDDNNRNINRLLKKEDLGSDVAEYQKWVDYDMKRYGKISDITNKKLDKAGLEVVKDKYGDYEVIAKTLNESVEKIEVTTDTDKIEIETKSKDDCTNETIVPLTVEDEDKIVAEVNVDDFSEEDFDELSEKYLKEVYSNVKNYKTSDVNMKNNKLFVEGIITFNSGKQKKTTFMFEAKQVSKKNKIKFIGENLELSRGKKSFALNTTINNKKLISESLTYKYQLKDNTGKSNKIYGTVRK